ncbi:carbohydrate esterase family 4 protein [Neofusicoccum parvum]|nr:carbohydrate esterase family 4 protein [Neofusicoccum parvum]
MILLEQTLIWNCSGSTTDYCGTGCNSAFGTCGTSQVTTTAATTGATAGGSTLTSSTVRVSSAPSSIATSSTVKTSSTSTASATNPTSTSKVSSAGLCGSKNGGQTCAGSKFGQCCSMWGFCGSSVMSCSIGCQKGFGTGCYF